MAEICKCCTKLNKTSNIITVKTYDLINFFEKDLSKYIDRYIYIVRDGRALVDFKIYHKDYPEHSILIDVDEIKFKMKACVICKTSYDEYYKMVEFYDRKIRELNDKIKTIKLAEQICLDARK